MNHLKMTKVFFLFLLQGWIGSSLWAVEALYILDQNDTLRHPTKIPVGERRGQTYLIDLPAGTPLQEIASRISAKREEIGLSPEIPLEQQDEFFYRYTWKTKTNDGGLVKSCMPCQICQIHVQEGQWVQQGDPLCTVEAMKMSHIMRAPFSGEIIHISSQEGEFVSENSTLMSFLGHFPEWENIDPEGIRRHKNFLFSFFPWARTSPIETTQTPHDPFPNNEITVQIESYSPSLPVSEILSPQNSLSEVVIAKLFFSDPRPTNANVFRWKTKHFLPRMTHHMNDTPCHLWKEILCFSQRNIRIACPRIWQIDNDFAITSEGEVIKSPDIKQLSSEVFSPPVPVSILWKEKLPVLASLLEQKDWIALSPSAPSNDVRSESPIFRMTSTHNDDLVVFQREKEKELSLQMKSSPLKSHKLSTLNDAEKASRNAWAQWICGLIVLSLWILSRKTKSPLLVLGKIKYLHAIDLNKQTLIRHRAVHNINSPWRIKRKSA